MIVSYSDTPNAGDFIGTWAIEIKCNHDDGDEVQENEIGETSALLEEAEKLLSKGFENACHSVEISQNNGYDNLEYVVETIIISKIVNKFRKQMTKIAVDAVSVTECDRKDIKNNPAFYVFRDRKQIIMHVGIIQLMQKQIICKVFYLITVGGAGSGLAFKISSITSELKFYGAAPANDPVPASTDNAYPSLSVSVPGELDSKDALDLKDEFDFKGAFDLKDGFDLKGALDLKGELYPIRTDSINGGSGGASQISFWCIWCW
eukprot:TRINITY_DN128_c0_g1_i2.p1 TRINITY_DN128_c0_g1~~TRINITY_DN128_c0_g1_i2.p1  ORF type:complete len:262 (+),score=72.98 TRINITY_DN128_c0_g1_i2:181-966(+)